MSAKKIISEDELEQLHLLDNGHTVSSAVIVALPPGDLSSLSRLSPQADYVLRIETVESPDASPCHFWMTDAQLRSLVAQAEHDFGPSHLERRQILEALERIERSLEN